MKISARFIILLVLMSSLTQPVLSQTSQKYKKEIEETREILQQERLTVIRRALPLTSAEAQEFWPFNEKYQADIKKIGDREVKLITLYSENYQKLTDKVANYIVQEHFAIVKTKNEIKFKTVLPIIKAARFFQIKNKIDSLNENDMARKIPLFEAPE